ncbi:ADP-ribose pyrophosphatase [Hylemonella gracilis str. Niagara R]|uniref:GDP-mannose pyrophosphatase n=1 Tax=Hylemonella gracilis str. Niagara R TaxID=1458275 RepID=A0A016XLI7_9BURK|nr:NUDIX hydrolase [Hylemonella gracilis]EYC52033.1 ADP-ribose pyrophosphatase [Hylemonella gracilis str. Niagara R]
MSADDKHLIERRLASETLFKGNFLEARRDTVALPDGRSATREYVTHPGAVVVVPLLDDGRVVVERQYRYPVGRVMVEFPAGKLDAGEDPLTCGQRELLEETGYSAREWARAGEMHLAIAYSTEVLHIYFARGLQQGERQLDEGEFLDVFAATPAQLLDWSRSGELTDAKSLSCLLWLQNLLSGAWTLDWHTDPGQIPTPAG